MVHFQKCFNLESMQDINDMICLDRGKAATEFGAKVAISLVNGDAFTERLDWNNFNEGVTLKNSVKTYKQRHAHYPEAVIADTIYRNRDNIAYCKANNI